MRIDFVIEGENKFIRIWELPEFKINTIEHPIGCNLFKLYEIKPEFTLEIKMAAHNVYFKYIAWPKSAYLDVQSASEKGIPLPDEIVDRIEIINKYAILKPLPEK